MNRFILTLIAINVLSLSAFAQTSKEREKPFVPTNLQRYGNDFEIVDFSLTESNKAVLETLNLSLIENSRLDSEDIMVTLPHTNYQVLLYAKNRVQKPYMFNPETETEHETE